MEFLSDLLRPAYPVALAAIVLANLAAAGPRRREKNLPFPLLPVYLYFQIPAVILYIYDGFEGVGPQMTRLEPNLDFQNWPWTVKLFVGLIVLHLLKFFLPALLRGRSLFRIGLSHVANLVAACGVFLLLERFLYPEATGLMGRIVIGLPLMAIHGFFQLFAYLCFLYGVLEFFFPGAVRQWRLNKEAQAMAERPDPRRDALSDKLDAQERMFNALSGTGPFTDEEAMLRGDISTREYLTGQIYREQKMDNKKL